MFRPNFQHAEPDLSDSSDDPDDPFTASYRAGLTSSRALNTTNHSGRLPARPKFDPTTAPRPPASDRRGWTRATAQPPHSHNGCIPEEEEEEDAEEVVDQQFEQHNSRTSLSSRATHPMSLRSSRNRLPVSRISISYRIENENVSTNTNTNANPNVTAKMNTQDANPPPQTSPHQNNMLETLLAPVLPQLHRLRATQLPPNNSAVQTKSTAQVLRARLLPVGRHVVGVSQTETDGRGEGGLEVELCDYIAHAYWPQHLMPANGLRVMEMYRNALFQEDVEGRLEMRGWDKGIREVEEEEVGWKS